jgi:hypothetical protein
MKNCIKYIFSSILYFFFLQSSFSQSLRLESTINSIGYYIENANSISNKVSYNIKFKESSATLWRKGIDPSVFNYDGGNKLFTGSILQLKAATNYAVEVNIIDSVPNIHTVSFTGTIVTRSETNISIPTLDTLWVSPIGKGHSYTVNLPGAVDTLFNLDYVKVRCGTTIVCRGGNYFLGNLTYNVNSSPCTNENNPIVITSAANELAVFDGSDSSAAATFPNWTVYNASQNIYTAVLPPATSFSALMLYDTLRLFPYATVYTQQFLGLNIFYRECLNNCATAFGSGFYRNGNNYYIKLVNGENPNGKKITVSKWNTLWSIRKNGASYNPKFIIKNLAVKNYGKADVTFNIFGALNSDISSTSLLFSNMNNVIVDNCNFEYNTNPVAFNGTYDSTIVQNCTIKDQTGKWMHGAFKNTSLTVTGDINWINDNGKYGRGLEKAFVFFDPAANRITKNIIIRKNNINGIVSGIAGRQLETSPVQDVDVYDNTIINCFDATDLIGNIANYRVWNNTISNCIMPFSLIPFSQNGIVYSNTGPAYIFRNVVYKSPSRVNLANAPDNFNPTIYVTYGGCEGPQNKTWSPGLKIQTGLYPANLRTDIHFYHNTMSVEDTLSYNFYIWKSTVKRIISKNNSWNAKFNVVNFEDIANQPNYSFLSLNDNYYSNSNKLGVVNAVHGNLSTCATYNNLDSLDKYLRLQTGSSDTTLLKIRGFNLQPNFTNAATGDFHLNANSPLIDKGEFINNISDVPNENYFDNAPDIGAFEKGVATGVRTIVNNNPLVSVYPNPATNYFYIQSNKKINSVNIYNSQGILVYTKTIANTNHTMVSLNLTTLTKGIYFVNIIITDKSRGVKKIVL